MAPRHAAIALATLAMLGVWLATRSPAPASARAGGPAACPLPPAVAPGEPPLQTDVPAGMAPVHRDDALLRPLAGFSVAARVLGREDYRLGREAEYSPTDLALGWGRMADDAVLGQLEIRQSGRWYRYRWRERPPIPPAEIVRSSANMHRVPADDAVAAALAGLRRDDRVRIDGWLVQVEAGDGWRWRSSLRRDDSGGGACELVYVCAVRRE